MPQFNEKGHRNMARGVPPNALVNSATGAAAAAVSASLAHDGTNVVCITGFVVTSTNPAATVSGVVTVTGLTGEKTLSFEFVESATLGGELNIYFPDPIPANDASTDIAVNVPAIASGGACAVDVFGFKSQYQN